MFLTYTGLFLNSGFRPIKMLLKHFKSRQDNTPDKRCKTFAKKEENQNIITIYDYKKGNKYDVTRKKEDFVSMHP